MWIRNFIYNCSLNLKYPVHKEIIYKPLDYNIVNTLDYNIVNTQ